MDQSGQEQTIDFTLDRNNLHREESITDLKVGSIRRLVPVTTDGTEDQSRSPIFVGHTQLMSPEGPVPIQAPLQAETLEEAIDLFPKAMQQALSEMIEKIEKMQKQQKAKDQDDSRIIIPGR